MQRIEIDKIATGALNRADRTERTSRKGIYKGEEVEFVQDANSMIADAAEELTFQAAEVVEKKIESRRVSKEKASTDLIKKIQRYMEMIPDLNRSELQNWLKTTQQHPPENSDEMLDSLEKTFKDVTHRYVALSLLEGETRDEKLKKVLEDTKARLEKEQGPEIRAGLNVSATAGDFAKKGLASIQDLRNFYRNTVLKYEGVNQTFKSILEQFPHQSFLDAVDYLLKAVGMDLQSRGPSIEPAELRQMLNDLYHLEALGSVYRNCDELLERTAKGFGHPAGLTAVELMDQLLDLKEKQWLTENDIRGLVDRSVTGMEEARIYFLQGLMDVTRQIPLKLFSNEDSRRKLLDRMQSTLDVFIEEEE